MRVTAASVIKAMNLQYLFGNDLYESGEFDEVAGDPEELAKKEGVNILSDKELHTVVIDTDKNLIIAALFTSTTTSNEGSKYGFDTVVDNEYQRQGIGKELISIGMEEFDTAVEAYGGEVKLQLDVINEWLVPFLERQYGLVVVEREGKHFIMGEK